MKLIEEYIEFDGSDVQIWKFENDRHSQIYKERFWWRYYFEVNGGDYSGGSINLKQARNKALAYLLDKEWNNLPPRAKQYAKRFKNS